MYKELENLDDVVRMFLDGLWDQWKKHLGVHEYGTLDRTVKKAMAEHGVDKVHLAGHSMGWLEAMAYALNNPEKIADVLTVGTPYQGSIMAPAGVMFTPLGIIAPTIWQITPGSAYLQDLRMMESKRRPRAIIE